MNARSILIVANGYPSKRYPLNGIFELDQAKALAGIGHKVVYVAIDLRSIRRWRKWGVHHFIRDHLDVYLIDIPIGRVPAKWLDAIGELALRFLYRRIRKEHGCPDLLHAHFLGPGVISANLSQKEKLPLVITEHTSSMNVEKLPMGVLIRAQKAYSQANCLVAVSNTLCKHLKLATGFSARCVHNIVDVEALLFKKRKIVDNTRFNFVSIGGLEYRKGFDILLKAFKKIHEKHDGAVLTVYGDGSQRADLENYLKRNNITASVKFMGLMKREEIGRELYQNDVFVLASRLETFGVVYIEAMAAGLPVIATRCGGPEDFVTPETGILIPVEDVNALTDAMEYMMLSRNEYDSIAISNYARTQFSPEKIASELTEIYTEILEGSN